MKTCRVINLLERDGVFNTLIDEYFLSKEDLDFVLIFTEWRPTVSVGNSQNIAADINISAVKKYGLDLVRRRSGGESVLVNREYIVFSVVGRRDYFPQDLTLLRKRFSEAVASALREMKVPAVYHPPDYVIVNNPTIQTLGNAAQIIKQRVVVMHGSVRYNLSEDNFTEIIETLLVNGKSLKPYREDVRKILGCVRKFTDIKKEDVKTAILQKLLEVYGLHRYRFDGLSEKEEKEIRDLVPNPVKDKPAYRSRGVCYLNLNGKCLIRVQGFEDSRGQG